MKYQNKKDSKNIVKNIKINSTIRIILKISIVTK